MSSAATMNDLFQSLEKLAYSRRVSTYTNLVFLTLLFYDHMITLEEEVEKIWPLPWRLPKFLFLFNRYLIPPAMLVNTAVTWLYTSKKCSFMMRWLGWPASFAIATVELMLIVRVLALYNDTKKVVVLLVVLFIANLAAFCAIGFRAGRQTIGIPGGQLFSGCVYKPPSFFYTQWIPVVIFESIIIGLTVYKALSYRRNIPALRVLARDSMIYFLIMFSFLMANLFFVRFSKGFLKGLWVKPTTIVACIAVARMSLNIREFSDEDKGTNHILSTENWASVRETTIGLNQTENSLDILTPQDESIVVTNR